MIAWAIETLAASTALMLAVLALRGPVRRAFGAELAYALWAIPALRLVLPPLPGDWHAGAAPIVAPIAELGRQAGAVIVPVAMPEAATGATWLALLPPLLAGAWVAGAALFLASQVVRYVRFRMALMDGAVALSHAGRVAIVESTGATGPLAFGILRRVVAFPPDFAGRYDADERDLALAHELGHHARGDLIANWFALALLALHWFNPVAWIAYRAFRADQEMANDAGVMARLGPAARHAYGCAIVKAAHGRALTPACHLHTIRDLKGRLRMLGRTRVSRGRRMAGTIGIVTIAFGALGLTASGTQAAETVRTKVETVTGVEFAALDPVAALQAVPATTPTPPQVDAARHGRTRVKITGNGKTHTLEGAAAEAYLAKHPVPVSVSADGRIVSIPPVTPVPPMPPMPSVPAVSSVPPVPPMPVIPEPPVVADRDCGKASGADRAFVIQRNAGDQRTTVICTDRIDAAARAAARAGERANVEGMRAQRQAMIAQRHAMVAQRSGMSAALAGLQSARRSVLAGVPAEHRAEALRGIDEAIAEMREEMASERD